MKRIIETTWSSDTFGTRKIWVHEQRPTRRIIAVDYQYVDDISSKVWLWVEKKERYFLPLPYVYFLGCSGFLSKPLVFFAKESVLSGPVSLYSASILPNTGSDGSVCFGPGHTGSDYLNDYWNIPFRVRVGEGFDIESHLLKWCINQFKPECPNYIKYMHNRYMSMNSIPSQLSSVWRRSFGVNFSFESWQNLTDQQFQKVNFDSFNNGLVSSFFQWWWNEKDHR